MNKMNPNQLNIHNDNIDIGFQQDQYNCDNNIPCSCASDNYNTYFDPSLTDSSYTTQYNNTNENTVQYPPIHGQTSPIPTPKQQYTQLNMNPSNSQLPTNNLLNINSSNSQLSTNLLNSSNMSFNAQHNYVELIKMEISGIEIIFRQKYLPNLNQCCLEMRNKRCQRQQTPAIINHTRKFQCCNHHMPVERQNNNAAVNFFCSSSDKSSVGGPSTDNTQNICNNQNFFGDKSQS